MTTTEKYKRAESLFNDRTKRELADMVVHREADLEDAKADNAKLRNDADLLRSMLQAKREDTHALMAENAGLRTALSAVLQCSGITKRDKGCDACPMYDKEKEYAWAGDWCGIRQFIRELGVDA